MIPLRDNIPSSRRPYVTYVILGLNIAVFAFELSLGNRLQAFINDFGVVPAAYSGGEGGWPERVFPLFTSMFMHGGWAHIFFNMLYLWIFADNVEDRLGHFRFAVFYILSGLGAILAHILLNPSSSAPCVGASGAIGGVLGAYMITYPRARVLVLIFLFYFIHIVELPALALIFIWFLTQVFSGLGTLGANFASGVAYWAHIGGFIVGLSLMLVLAPRRKRKGTGEEYTRDPRRRR